MGWTKRAIIQSAYAELGVSTVRGFDLTPEDYQEGNQRLDGLMQRFYQQGYRLGYPSPAAFGTGDLDDDSGIPDGANEAVYLSLALRLAPTLGKAVSVETTKAHTAAMMAMARGFSDPIPQRRTNDQSPAGAGNRTWQTDGNPFLDAEYDDPLSANMPGNLGNY